jgi:hypothetical protein
MDPIVPKVFFFANDSVRPEHLSESGSCQRCALPDSASRWARTRVVPAQVGKPIPSGPLLIAAIDPWPEASPFSPPPNGPGCTVAEAR